MSGIAIDASPKNPAKLALAFEIIDTLTPKEAGQVGSKLLETEGKTIFEAVHNTDQQLYSEMYFGNTELLLISNELASKEGINPVVEAFIRDFATRDNLILVISKEETAKELITPSGKEESSIISYSINKAMGKGVLTVNSTRPQPLYKIYNCLATDTDALALPVLRFKDKEAEEKTLMLDGMAVFDKDKMVGYLENEYVPALLLATETLGGGTFVYSFLQDGELVDVTLQIKESTPSVSSRFEDGRFIFTIEIKAKAGTMSLSPKAHDFSEKAIDKMEQEAEKAVAKEITAAISHVQNEFGMDIFELGKSVRKQHYDLWLQCKDNWKYYFENAVIEVKGDFIIEDIGMIKNYEVR